MKLKLEDLILPGAAAAVFFVLSESTKAADRSEARAKRPGGIPAGAAAAFIKQYYPEAIVTERYYQVPALVTIAQAGLEGAYGTSAIAKNSRNHFGIKADPTWKGQQYNGYRLYPDVQSSFNDHAKFLVKNPRYDQAFLVKDPEEFARRIAAAGYAEDPDYAAKLIRTMQLIKGMI